MSRSFRRSQSTALRVSRAPAAISPSMRRSGTRSPFVTPENSRSSLSRLDDRAAPVAGEARRFMYDIKGYTFMLSLEGRAWETFRSYHPIFLCWKTGALHGSRSMDLNF